MPDPDCQHHANAIEDLQHAVFGNGREGLLDRMTRLESRIDTGVSMLKWIIGLLTTIVGIIGYDRFIS